jgi:TorA maturation chaperone TorD
MNTDIRVTAEELGNRITLYAVISRLMMIEVDADFLKSIESNESLLSLFPKNKNWEKRKEFGFSILKERYLDVDYTNLFLLHLVPYESFYTRDDQMIETGLSPPLSIIWSSRV